MKTFKINGKTYTAKGFDFNMVCDLDDLGISIDSLGSKPMSLTRAYFSLCAEMSIEDAGKEIEKHVISGGSLDPLADVMRDAIENSDFFRTLNQTTETETPEPQKKTTKKQA